MYYDLADMPARYTNSWKTVSIEDVGNFKIPKEWRVKNKDGILYITNNSNNEQEDTPYLIGTTLMIIKNNEKKSSIQPHEVLEGVEKGNHISSVNYSNGARVSLFEYYVQGKKEEHYLVTISKFTSTQSATFELLIWDKHSVDDNLANQIAKTFCLE